MSKTKNKFEKLPKISNDALIAIRIGVEQKHSISNLEKLGIKQRLLNLLECNSITDLSKLMNLKKEDLLKLPNFGEKQLFMLFEGLSNYHNL
jgi:DNA-directed RNA polymerase alpha subunit